MPRQNWQQFERLVAAIHHAEMQGGDVQWNEKINGRQFDVTIRFKNGFHEYLTVIECKDYKGKVSVEKIDAFATKSRDINANKAVMVSSNGYQEGCSSVASRHGIILLTLNEKIDISSEQISGELTPAINVYDVSLYLDGNVEYILEDYPAGRLQYLMDKIQIKSDRFENNLNAVIASWQTTKFCKFSKEENESSINFPPDTIASIPYYLAHNIVSMKFKYKIIDAIISDKPFFDNHIIEGMSTRYELLDEDGKVKCTKSLSELKLGHYNNIEKECYYYVPSISCHYYCHNIDENYLYFILVESYQHGQLLRARIKTDIKNSERYVKVTDTKILARLRILLDDYNRLDGDINPQR